MYSVKELNFNKLIRICTYLLLLNIKACIG